MTRAVAVGLVLVALLTAGCAEVVPGQHATSTTADPQTGDELVSVTQVNESTAMRANASKRATFENLTDAQQAVFLEALRCDCNVEQDVFHFSNKSRVEYVRYDGTWYFVRVSVV